MRETALAKLDPQALISQAIAAGSGIDTLERLVALAKDVREVQAREAWHAALAEFQRQCPTIKKTAVAKIQTSRASYSYRYAPLDEIMAVIQPLMGQLGLSVSWRSRVESDKIIVSCRISHTLGHHEESGDIAMPIERYDGIGANPAQRVGIAATYAKRYSLLGIIGMAPEDDDDAGGKDGAPDDSSGASIDDTGARITGPQQKRFYAIARGTKPAWTEEQIYELLTSHQLVSAAEIPMAKYDAIIDRLKLGPGAKG